MTPQAFSDEWSRACCERLNARAEYRRAAADWTSPVVLVMRADPARGVPAPRAVFLDLFRGECRGARLASPADRERADYVLAADPPVWRRLLERDLDPISAVIFGKLKLEKGSLSTLFPFAGAAREMISAAAEVAFTLPGEAD